MLHQARTSHPYLMEYVVELYRQCNLIITKKVHKRPSISWSNYKYLQSHLLLFFLSLRLLTLAFRMNIYDILGQVLSPKLSSRKKKRFWRRSEPLHWAIVKRRRSICRYAWEKHSDAYSNSIVVGWHLLIGHVS